MSLQPLVSWRLRDNSAKADRWDIGVVDASTVSPDFGFLIWNNYKGDTAVADMEDAAITTKDQAGGNTGDLVLGQWVEVRVDTMKETTFTKIGFDSTANGGTGAVISHPVQTEGSTVFNGITSTPGDANHKSVNGTTSLLGVANDGTKENAKGNFAEVTLHARVPGNATAGLMNFITRVTYRYV